MNVKTKIQALVAGCLAVVLAAAPASAIILGSNLVRFDPTTTLTAAQAGSLASSTTITAGTTQTQAGATQLNPGFSNVTTCATASDGVKLPQAIAGRTCVVRNSGAAVLRVWPSVGDAIASLAVNLSVDIPVKGQQTFRAIDATTWKLDEKLTLQSPTTLTGSLVIDATASAGNTVTRITNASQAAARTYTLPDLGASGNFVLSAVDQITSMTTTATPGTGSNGVQFVFKNGAGNAVTGVRRITSWISDSAGAPVTAVTSFVALTNGNVDLIVTGKIYACQTTAAGLLGLTVTGSAATRYVSFQLNDGTILTSSAIVIN